jgi:hypothetical protein
VEEDMRIYHNHEHIYRTEMKQSEQQTITREVIMEFNNLAYVSESLSQWGRLLYFCSKLNKYITTRPKGYKIDLVFFS